MTKVIHIRSLIFAFASIFLLLPGAAGAYMVSFDVPSDSIYIGDTFIVSVLLSDIDEPTNAIDGSVTFDKDKLQVTKLSTGGSVFILWVKFPEFSNQEGTVNFLGGVPGGFMGKEAEILKIAFLAKSAGEAKLDFSDELSLFLNDGNGTKAGLRLRPETLLILERPVGIAPKDEWQEIISADKTPPEPFEIELGRDPAIFDNKYFISFAATDRESGIDYYEVKEGKDDFVRAESPYVLKDQSLRGLIMVKAVDMAGNERTFELSIPDTQQPFYRIFLFLIITGLAATAYIILRKIKAKNKRV